MDQRLVCLVDTNIFLHFKPLDELDWPTLCGEAAADLMVGIEVVRELDEHKHHSGNRLKKRAGAALRCIEERSKDTGPDASLHVTVAFQEATVDWAGQGLDPTIADDRIIARAIALRQDGRRVMLATDDTALRLKATAHGFDCCAFSDEDRATELKSEDELELEQLRAQLRTLRAAVSDLTLGFLRDNEIVNHANFILHPLALMSEEALATLVEEETRPHAYVAPPPVALTGLAGIAMMPRFSFLERDPTEQEIQEYQEAFARHKAEYADYIRLRDGRDALNSRTVSLQLVIKNDGQAPGDDIHVVLHVPDPVVVLESSGEETPWDDTPAPPPPPRKPWQRVLPSDALSRTMFLPSSFARGPVTPPNVSPPSIRRTNSYEIAVDIRRLKQAMLLNLDPIYVFYPEETFNFSMTYKIICGTRPGVQDGVLHVVVE
ncbi:MAG: PIN domain-containing protein [Armatimonadia bacterium]